MSTLSKAQQRAIALRARQHVMRSKPLPAVVRLTERCRRGHALTPGPIGLSVCQECTFIAYAQIKCVSH